jgi:hypothetical protein
MKLLWLNRAALMCVGLLPLGAVEELELSGISVMKEGREVLVVIHDKTAVQSSPWLGVGGEWRGYKVTAIRAEEDAATLSQGTTTRVVRLRGSQVKRVVEATLPDKAWRPGNLPFLVRGTFTREGIRVIYSRDAIVKIGNATVEAVTGQMEYQDGVLRGDMQLDRHRVVWKSQTAEEKAAGLPEPGFVKEEPKKATLIWMAP